MKKAILQDALKVLTVGGAAAGLSATAIGLACMAVWIFCTIPATSGYTAVTLFALATLSVVAALAIVYFSGCWIVRKGKFSK
jgi:hypothetical protein